MDCSRRIPAGLADERTIDPVKLYYTPGSCSLAPHIVARELGMELQLVRVDLASGLTEDGRDFRLLNAKGSVPALETDSGELLTETAVILAFLCDQRPDAAISKRARFDRYRVQEAVNYVATELHKTLGLLFNPQLQQQSREAVLAMLHKRLDYLDSRLERSNFLVGSYSIADAYAFTVLGWTKFLKIDLAPWPNVRNFRARVGERSNVRAALAAEGIAEGAA
jgi:glutathione S-transferase